MKTKINTFQKLTPMNAASRYQNFNGCQSNFEFKKNCKQHSLKLIIKAIWLKHVTLVKEFLINLNNF